MPELTMKMIQHINSGDDFSELHYEVLADDKPTGITRRIQTDGSPNYKVVADEIHYHEGEDYLDVLQTESIEELRQWVEDRISNAEDT